MIIAVLPCSQRPQPETKSSFSTPGGDALFWARIWFMVFTPMALLISALIVCG